MADRWKTGVAFTADRNVEEALGARLDPQVKLLFEESADDAVEELILSRIEATPGDLNFFMPVFRHFIRNDKKEAVETYYELLLEAYRKGSRETEEIALLRALVTIWPDAPDPRKKLLEHIHRLYGDTPNYKRLLTHCRLLESGEPQAAFKRFENWLRYDEGRTVYLATRGVGRVREINLTLDTIRVHFALSGGILSFKPDEAERMLEPLPPGHFLVETLDRTAELRALAKTDGAELLRRLFTAVARPVPLSELREMLVSIVDPPAWTSWWTAARKDRRLTVNKSNLCTWSDSADDADSTLLEQFMAATTRERLDLVRKFSKRSAKLAAAMASVLLDDAKRLVATDGALSLELFLALEKLPDAGTGAERSAAVSTLVQQPGALDFVRRLSDRIMRKRALALVREHRDDWHALFAEVIRSESDSQSITLLYEALRENDPAFADALAGETMSSPTTAPNFFVWLCRELASRPELDRFANMTLLQLLLRLLQNNALKEHNAALRKMFDDDGAFHTVARRLDTEQAKHLIGLLDRDSSLEDYRREKMLKDMRAWYPQTHEVKDTTFFVSAAALAVRQAEFTRITTIDIPHNTEEIMKARAHGDLRENFEYHAARARQEMLSSRAKTLHDELQFARPIDFARIDPAVVCIGTGVMLKPAEAGEKVTIAVLGPWDSDPDKHVYSYMAPVAAALLGKKVGDPAEFNGKPYVIAEIFIAEERQAP
jgi:transcription elongation GreA/GreB family factor